MRLGESGRTSLRPRNGHAPARLPGPRSEVGTDVAGAEFEAPPAPQWGFGPGPSGVAEQAWLGKRGCGCAGGTYPSASSLLSLDGTQERGPRAHSSHASDTLETKNSPESGVRH